MLPIEKEVAIIGREKISAHRASSLQTCKCVCRYNIWSKGKEKKSKKKFQDSEFILHILNYFYPCYVY
jgi:hypothetical protein